MVEVPSWVKEIQPTVVRVPLTDYSTNGELFSKAEEIERFFRESCERWMAVPATYGHPPYVFIMDFNEIRILKSDTASSGFAFVLSNFVGGERDAHVVFDNSGAEGENNPWESLSSALEHRRGNRVAIARQSGKGDYQLIGAPITAGRHWQHIFSRLTSERDWVLGQDFVKRDLDLQIQPVTVERYLRQMGKEGLVLREFDVGRFYYKSPV